MKLEKIIIGLENCECISIEAKYIEYIRTGKITSEFSTFNSGDYFDESFSTDYLYIMFKDFDDVLYSNWADHLGNVKERLKLNDITSVEFFYSDSEPISVKTSRVTHFRKDVRVPWHVPFYARFLKKMRKWMYTNKYQKCFDKTRRDSKKYFCIEIDTKFF